MSQPLKLAKVARFFILDEASFLDNSVRRVLRISPQTAKKVTHLKSIAASENLVSLSSIQSYMDENVFVINRRASEIVKWKSEAYNNPDDYLEFINPSILEGSEYQKQSQTEQCPSFPHIIIRTKRFGKIRTYRKILDKSEIQQDYEGFMSRVIQHEVDHLSGGSLLDWDLHQGSIQLDSKLVSEMPRTQHIIEQYSELVKKRIRDYPSILKDINTQKYSNKNYHKTEISEEQDMVRRIAKHFRKEYLIYQARKEVGV